MIRIEVDWVYNPFVRINTGIDMLPVSTPSVSPAETSLAPFTLYELSTDEDYCYVAVTPALVNDIVPVIADVSIESLEVPSLAMSLVGKHYIYLNFILTEDSTALESVEVSDEAGDYYIELGYIEAGVLTSYRSTSLGVHICGDEVNVWAS